MEYYALQKNSEESLHGDMERSQGYIIEGEKNVKMWDSVHDLPFFFCKEEGRIRIYTHICLNLHKENLERYTKINIVNL